MSSIMRASPDHTNAGAEGAPATDELLEALHAALRALRGAYQRGGEPGLSPLDGRVLAFFARQPGATQKDLACHSGRDKGQLARLIQGLRQRGLLSATPDADDRRNLRLQLTPLGQQWQQAQQAHMARLGEVAAGALSPEERAQLVALLGKVRAAVAQTPG